MIEQLYQSLLEYYYEKEEERRKNTGDREIHVTTLTQPCEQKAVLAIKGVQPPDRALEDVGARLHGNILHSAFEEVIHRKLGGFIIEEEFKLQLGNWTILAHPDMLAKIGDALYDLKFINPYSFHRIKNSQKNPLGYVWQLNMYAHILRSNGINVFRAYLEYFSKSTFTVRGKNPTKVREFEPMELPAPLDNRIIRVILRHTHDIIQRIANNEQPLGLEDSIAKLKQYYIEEGLDPKDIDQENYTKWMCEHCDYKDMCPALQLNKTQAENKDVEMEVF